MRDKVIIIVCILGERCQMVRNSSQLELADALRGYEANRVTFSTDMVAERTNYTRNSINR